LMIEKIIIASLGGAIGSSLRFLIKQFVQFFYSKHFFLATIIVNVVGCFLIGAITGMQIKKDNINLFLMTGLLGGFTTFSAFCLESFKLLQLEQYFQFFLYIFSNLFISFICFLVGFWLVTAFKLNRYETAILLFVIISSFASFWM